VDVTLVLVEAAKTHEVLSDAGTKAIGSNGLGAILPFVFRFICDDIVRVARYGICSFHRDRALKYRGHCAVSGRFITTMP
jgi:hypothetical protein